jgi:hypothetical protein
LIIGIEGNNIGEQALDVDKVQMFVNEDGIINNYFQ